MGGGSLMGDVIMLVCCVVAFCGFLTARRAERREAKRKANQLRPSDAER